MAKNTVYIYEKPTCSTCRLSLSLLNDAQTEYVDINYYEKPFIKEKLKSLIKKMGISARDLLRTKEKIYKELKLAEKNLSEDKLVDLMIKHPDLMQRPIVEKGNKAVLGRPPEKIISFLNIK